MDGIDGAAVKIPGVPFDINPQKFLPLIAKQVSDEMLDKMADFLLIVATDILKIRAAQTPLLLTADSSEAASLNDETIRDSTELSQERAF